MRLARQARDPKIVRSGGQANRVTLISSLVVQAAMPLASQILLSTQRRPSILAAASVVLSTLFFVTWASYGKKSKDKHSALFADATTSARRIRASETKYAFDEYDVVIVGGGKHFVLQCHQLLLLDRSLLGNRNVGMHSGFEVVRGSLHTGTPIGSW